MKKTLQMFSVALVISMLALVLTGCGKDLSNSPYVGKWSATTASMSGSSVTVDVNKVFGEFSFDLQKDGKCTAVLAGEKQTGSWDETDNGFAIDKDIKVVGNGDTGSLGYQGITISFKKS